MNERTLEELVTWLDAAELFQLGDRERYRGQVIAECLYSILKITNLRMTLVSKEEQKQLDRLDVFKRKYKKEHDL